MSEPFQEDTLSLFIHYRTDARYLPDLGRRETPDETDTRFIRYLMEKAGDAIHAGEWELIDQMIRNKDIAGSRRLVWSAGPACESTGGVAAYNCAYIALNDLRAFAEIMYVLMCGTGCGFSVEEEEVSNLPRIKKPKKSDSKSYTIEDSREGWANSLLFGLEAWFEGEDVEFDFSELRPYGAILQTFGGRSSGPEPLRNLLNFARARIRARAGKHLRPIDAHDIACMVGEAVIVGGTRRSALLSLSDLTDYDMRLAKFGAFYEHAKWRQLANNSVAYGEKPSSSEFLDEMVSLMKSGSGERGIFNRENSLKYAPRRKRGRYVLGINPCGEIVLRPYQFCNLSSTIARPGDRLNDLVLKTRCTTIIGTIQATLTDFKYLREDWQRNCEEERLLGVSLSGQMDCEASRDPEVQRVLRETAIAVNDDIAQRLGINPSAAITTVKPEGTNALRVRSSPGVHTREAKYMIRRVRISASDPLFSLCRTAGVPHYPEVGDDQERPSTWVLEFPIASPEGCVLKDEQTAIQQLEYAKQVRTNYAEHSVSCTVYVGEEEWPSVIGWVWNNWDFVSGISFLPRDNSVYRLAPQEGITQEEYEKRLEDFPEIDYSLLAQYEQEDMTTGSRDYACAGDSCTI